MKTINFLRKVLKVVLVAFVSFGISFGSVPRNLYAVEVENEEVRYALDELNRNSYWNWQVVADEYAGMPKTLYGSLTNRHEGEQIEVAQQFLSDYLYSTNIFGIENNLFDYKMVDVIYPVGSEASNGVNSIGTYILYIQTYNNIPIEHSYLLISVTPQKSISLVKSKIFVHLDINTNPQLGEQEAYNIAVDDARETAEIEETGDAELIIFPNKEKIQVAWKVQFKADEFGGMIEYIISDSGEILEKINKQGNPLPQDLPKNENPIFNQEDVISVLNSLENNPALIDETKKLADIISGLEYTDYKQTVSEALITSALNVFNNPQNLPAYIEILKNNNFISEEVYNQFLAKIQEAQNHQTKDLIPADDTPLILIDSEPLIQIPQIPDAENVDITVPQTTGGHIPDTTIPQTADESNVNSNTQPEQTADEYIPPRIPVPDSIGSDSSVNNVLPDTNNPGVEPVMAKTTETEESAQQETAPVLTQEQMDQMQAAMEETIRNAAIVSAAQELSAVAAVENTVEPLLSVLNESISTPLDTSGPKPENYVVQTGDTAGAIALYYSVDAGQLGSVSSGQELYFPAAHNEPYHEDTLEEAQAQVNDGYRMLQSAQNEIAALQAQSAALMADPMTMAAGAALQVQIQVNIIKLHAAEQTYSDLVRHLAAVQDQIQNQQSSGNNSQDNTSNDSNNNNTETETQTESTTTTNPAYYGHEPYPQTTQTSDTTGDISDFLDDPSPSSSDGAAATGSLSGYDSDGAAATGGLSGYNSGDDAGATGTLTGYYIPPSGYTTTSSSSSSSQGSGATGGISGYDYTPGSNLIAQSETCDGSGGSSGGTGTTGGVSG